MSQDNRILIKGARENNLKNVDVEIPRNKLVVITGISGSGKSSLAFDTLYAEGHRRFAESLSAFARQFLGRIPKPSVDNITGIPPAIAVEQKVSTSNARSTIATTTEIYNYLKIIFAKIGRTYSPVTGCEVRSDTEQSVLDDLMARVPAGNVALVAAPAFLAEEDFRTERMLNLKEDGFIRLVSLKDGTILRIDDVLSAKVEVADYSDLCVLV
ncbi:MAG: excinuclease ABC subunit A, partial [Bacteroidales bacterium]|nr:excinuclease ABC subunit A [Bacteroidales bacterium]